jgi:adenine nucleotide transporter 17
MLAGALAGSATVLITNPIWVINTRMTAKTSDSKEDSLPGGGLASKKPAKKPSTLGTLVALLREEGPMALFAGVLPALVLVVNPILQYTIFEQLKNLVERRRRVRPMDAFVLGAVGKLLATSITYPYITVKSRMHVARRSEPQEGMVQSVRRIVREEGWAGLYKGEACRFVFGLVLSCELAVYRMLMVVLGIGPKVTQSVVTAAFLFAFKDALYEYSVQVRRKIPAKLPLPLK